MNEKKLQNAYDTISDATKRREYDLRWPGIRDGLRARQESEKRQAEAERAEEKRAAEARAKRQQEDTARAERLRNLEQNRCKYDNDIFELSRVIRKLAADLKRLKEQDDEDARKEKERNGWWAYLKSPIYGQAKETDEQKQERENKRLQRNAAKRIKGSDLAEKEARLKTLQEALRGVDRRIAIEKEKVADEKRRLEEEEKRARKLKMEQEARDRRMREERERMAKWQKEQDEQAAKRAREARERMAKWQKEQEEQAAKRAREAQAAREAWEAQARERAAAAAEEKGRREANTRAEAMRRAQEETTKKAKKAPSHRSGPTTQSTCHHAGWWPKVEGRQLCGKCDTFQNRFLLQCPGCKMVACASCQKSLRGGGTWKSKGGGGGGAGRQYGFAGNEWDDIPSYDYDYD